jgi:hypothetical protein
MNAFAMSCPIPAPVVGALNTTKAVEVALAAYRYVVLPVFFVPFFYSMYAVGASTWTPLHRLCSLSACEQLSHIPLHFPSKNNFLRIQG